LYNTNIKEGLWNNIMLQDERQSLIVEVVNSEGKITVGEICHMYAVSEMTARRDLRILDQKGFLRRVHGGAISTLGRSYEPPYNVRATQAKEAKKAIGKKAAEMIYDGDSIALDVGTTTMEIARSLKGRRNLTVVTASLPIANYIVSKFSIDSDLRLIITGGVVRPREFSMVGHIPESVYNDLHVDKAFVGIGGLSLESGLTEYNLEDTLVKRALLFAAQENIVVAEGSKIGRTTFAKIGSLSSFQTLITDQSAPNEIVESLRDMGINVIFAI
jgi:DeoR/GlpR family transcriptional regulator of sugar metabolism